ncbi:hypothetical protein TSUD_190570 [Trifolium subterraneum]|uniref:CYTH domain-containing protein n=1 Tax=Trifolium subterraneum TaxID=3900 RepID=A0A2Z6PR55_TRISU|nr:hypothetical protein TSUD_190570 [Trifolium subterraneum]
MAQESFGDDSQEKHLDRLKEQVRLVKRKDCERYEIAPIQSKLSFENGAGKTVFSEKIFNSMPEVAVISMDNYNDSSRIVDGNFDDPRLTDYETLLRNVHDLKAGKPVEVPVYDFKSSSRTGYSKLLVPTSHQPPCRFHTINTTSLRPPESTSPYSRKACLPALGFLGQSTSYTVPSSAPRWAPIVVNSINSHQYLLMCRAIRLKTVEVPSSRIVIIEGIYALSERLRPLLDLRVSVTGGVHLDLVKRVIRDIQRAGQEPQEIIHQISETVYPMYKAYIEPDLQTAHVKITNKFNPFFGFQSPTYILKSTRNVTVDQIKAIISQDFEETTEQTYDIYLLPPGEDPESCQSYLRMRNKDGKYSLMFEEWVTDDPFVISPRITFAVSVRLLGGLMALGYTIATILKRSSHVLSDDRVCVKLDWLEQLNRHYVQVQGKDRLVVTYIAQQLDLEGSYVPRTYIEQIQLEKLVMAMPDELKTKLNLNEDLLTSPKAAFFRTSNDGAPGAITQLSEQISSLHDRMGEFTNRIEELNSKLTIKENSPSQQKMDLQAESYDGSVPTSCLITSLSNGSLNGSIMSNPSLPSQLAKEESPLRDEVCVFSDSTL